MDAKVKSEQVIWKILWTANQAKPPMVDALSTLSKKISAHTDGKVYYGILGVGCGR
jgi:hypothetical protein